MIISENLQLKIADLPERSGVYIMRDSAGHIIYIGKAVVLKNRVKQYFSNSQKEKKVMAMVNNIFDFDYIITLSEKDALSLEANLIRKHKPKYNILLKDDKHSPYIKIDTRLKFPTIEITRKVKRDGAKYFGPYFHGVRVSDIVEIIKSAYKMRACPKNFYSHKRECLNYHIDLCYAPCCNNVSEKDYNDVVAKVIAFLSGREDTALKVLTDRMNGAVESEDFERAIKYRDQITMIDTLKKRTLLELDANHNIDAISCIFDGEYGAVSVSIVRAGKLMGVRNYPVTGAFEGVRECLEQFISQYYSNSNVDIPSEILLEENFSVDTFENFLGGLSGERINISVPKVGIKRKLVLMARENASDCLVKSLDTQKRDYEMCEGAVKSLGEILGIAHLRRMECYDISNISGVDKVASGVVFIDGKMAKSEYRRYKIKTVEGANDFACMAEVLSRRIERAKKGDEKFTDLPDLIVIDGGKGQLSSAYEIMSNSGLDINMVGLAKREEEIFTVGKSEPIILKRDSFALKLLQRIRDEAHRFAITYHRNLRSKRYNSELDNIKGVGEKKRQILLKEFSKFSDIVNASEQQLASIKGIDKKTAVAIVEYFKNKNK